MSLRCLSSRVMSLLAHLAVIQNRRKKCLLSDSRWVSSLSHHQWDHQGQAAQPVVPLTAQRAISFFVDELMSVWVDVEPHLPMFSFTHSRLLTRWILSVK
jgi:hypothetical protein